MDIGERAQKIKDLQMELSAANQAIADTLKRGEKFNAGASQGTGAGFAFTPLKDLYAYKKRVEEELVTYKKGILC